MRAGAAGGGRQGRRAAGAAGGWGGGRQGLGLSSREEPGPARGVAGWARPDRKSVV